MASSAARASIRFRPMECGGSYLSKMTLSKFHKSSGTCQMVSNLLELSTIIDSLSIKQFHVVSLDAAEVLPLSHHEDEKMVTPSALSSA